MRGVVEGIAIRPTGGELPTPIDAVEALAGRGLRGDCNLAPHPTERDGRDLTLIEAEALAALAAETGIELSHEQTRRNVLTSGVRLNDLVGRRFRIGAAECVGVMLNEPCAHLEQLTEPGVLKGLVHRGGLRANILSNGRIEVGDELVELRAA